MKVRASLSPIAGLLLLSVLWAFAWLLPDLFPASGGRRISVPMGETIFFVVMAALSSFVAVARRREFSKGRSFWAWCAIGIALFVMPAIAAAFARDWISDFDQVGIFCLTPIFAAVLEPYLTDNPTRTGKAALAGGLVAFAGVLCLFPIDVPGSFRAAAALAVCLVAAFGIAAANCLAVRLASVTAGESMLPAAAQAAGASAICFAAITAVSREASWASVALSVYLPRLVLIDIPAFLLLFWLMSRMGATRMSTRFLLAPLFASLVSLALEATLPPSRALIGLALLTGGAGWLIFAPVEDQRDELISLSAERHDRPTRPPR